MDAQMVPVGASVYSGVGGRRRASKFSRDITILIGHPLLDPLVRARFLENEEKESPR